jgi:hypothetical protein
MKSTGCNCMAVIASSGWSIPIANMPVTITAGQSQQLQLMFVVWGQSTGNGRVCLSSWSAAQGGGYDWRYCGAIVVRVYDDRCGGTVVGFREISKSVC